MIAARGALLAATLALARCASSDPTYYTLATMPGATASAPARSIEIRRPGLAGYLDRSDIVLKSADYRLSVNSGLRWAEPLGDMIGRVLAEDLAERLPSSSVYTEAGAISADPDLRVEVDIDRFDPDGAGRVVLTATVAITAGRGHAALSARRVVLTVTPGGAGAGAAVAAMSAAVAELADRITLDLARMPAVSPAAS